MDDAISAEERLNLTAARDALWTIYPRPEDYFAAPEFLHPEAIYIHGAQTYQVKELDWEGRRAYVDEVAVGTALADGLW